MACSSQVELVKLTTPAQADEEHHKLVENAEACLRALKLPYRKVRLCSGDIGFSARLCYGTAGRKHERRTGGGGSAPRPASLMPFMFLIVDSSGSKRYLLVSITIVQSYS